MRNKAPKSLFSDTVADDETVLFTLSAGETLLITDNDESPRTAYIVTSLNKDSNRLNVRGVNDSTRTIERFSASKLRSTSAFEKALITPAGLVRSAND